MRGFAAAQEGAAGPRLSRRGSICGFERLPVCIPISLTCWPSGKTGVTILVNRIASPPS